MCQDCSSASTFWPKSVASVASRMLISVTRLRLLASSLAPARTNAVYGPLQQARFLDVEAEVFTALIEIGDAGE